MIDEVDGRKSEDWPYDAIYKKLDLNEAQGRPPTVFVLIGSSGATVNRLGEVIRERLGFINQYHWAIVRAVCGCRIEALRTHRGCKWISLQSEMSENPLVHKIHLGCLGFENVMRHTLQPFLPNRTVTDRRNSLTRSILSSKIPPRFRFRLLSVLAGTKGTVASLNLVSKLGQVRRLSW